MHPVFQYPVAPYRYLLSIGYLVMADIASPNLFVCCCRTWICLDITRFMRSSARHPAGPHGRLAQNSQTGSHCWGREVSTQFAQQFVTAMTTPPLVSCFVWTQSGVLSPVLFSLYFDQVISQLRHIGMGYYMNEIIIHWSIYTC